MRLVSDGESWRAHIAFVEEDGDHPKSRSTAVAAQGSNSVADG
jgi:hypothetical protein